MGSLGQHPRRCDCISCRYQAIRRGRMHLLAVMFASTLVFAAAMAFLITRAIYHG